MEINGPRRAQGQPVGMVGFLYKFLEQAALEDAVPSPIVVRQHLIHADQRPSSRLLIANFLHTG